jgi:hypothetical protein
VAFLALNPEILAYVMSLLAGQLHGLARVSRDLLSNIALASRGLLS